MGYTEAFLTERPQDGLDVVQTRLRRAKALNEQFANYFKERAHIEDMYAKNITKAFQRHFVTDSQALGTFTAPWEKLNAESLELATLHGQFSLRISNEIERPLRDFARSNSEWQNLSLAETNCNRIAKEFDEKNVKVAKYTKAVEKASGKKAEATEQKLMDYTKQLESTRTAWRLEGPVVLQKYQSVDQSRLEHLKQVVSAFETIQTEVVLQVAEISGRTSTSVAEFEPVMDIELFASEMSTNMHSIEPPHDGVSIASATSHPSNRDTIGSMDPHRSNGVHKRGMTGSSQLSDVSYSTDRSAPQSMAASIDHTRTVDTQDQMRSGSSVLGSALDVPTNHVDADGFSIPPPDHGPWSDNGMSSTYDDERSETSSFSQAPKMQMEIRQDSVSESNDEAKAALERVTSTLKQTKTVSRRHPGRREVRSMYQSEDSLSGFNSFQSSPLSATFTSDSTRDSGTPPSMSSPGSRVFFNTSASNLQTGTSFSPAASRASTLGLPSSSSPIQSQFNSAIHPTPPLPHVNGSSSESSTHVPVSILGTHQPLAAEPESMLSSAPTSPITATPANRSLAPGAGQKRTWVVSVIEKVHAHTQAGEVTKMMVTGEVILNQEGTEAPITPDQQPRKALLRLGHLGALEKYVPNQAYLAAKEGAEGTYWVDLETLSQAMQQNGLGQGQGVVVLKYQVRTNEEEAKQTMIPLLIQPAWKCEPHQTSLLINYKANAHCKLSLPTPSESSTVAESSGGSNGAGNVHLSELSFLVPVSGEVVSAQSRPTGIWNKESNKMFWDVDNVVMSHITNEPHKLLARFEMNPSGGTSQPSPTAVKFRVQGRLLSDLMIHLEREQEEEVEEEGQEGQDGQGSAVAFGSVRLQVQSGRYLATA